MIETQTEPIPNNRMDDMTQTNTKTLKSADTQTTIPTPEPEPKQEEPLIEPTQTRTNENPQNVTFVNPNTEIEIPVITKVKPTDRFIT